MITRMAEEKKNKRYFWLKLENTYFKRLDQRKMCKQKNGYDMQRIYLKMMLLAVDKGGYIPFQGVYDSIQEEIAEELFEDIELVNQTVEYAQKNKLLEMNELQIFLPQVLEMTGSETDSARRVRKHRESKSLQCNTDETSCNTEKEIELESEKEIEKEHTHKEKSKEKFVAPQECEVEKYLADRNVKSFTAKEFINYYASTGWKNKHGVPIIDWKALLNTWIDRKEESKQETQEKPQKEPRDFMSAELVDKLMEIGALDEDGCLYFGIAQEHGLLDVVQEADRKANKWNSELSKKQWKPVYELDADEWQ